MTRNVITPKGRAARIEGIPELKTKVSALLNRMHGKDGGGVRSNIKVAYMKAAMMLVHEIRAAAPYDPGRHGSYGKGRAKSSGVHLRDAVFASYGHPDAPNVLVGMNQAKSPEAHWVEYGTVFMSARPYFRPSIVAARPMVANVMAENLRTIVQAN